jgi:dissimilatory sulfite reductase (desulfoviridin) alpha/beta subunit
MEPIKLLVLNIDKETLEKSLAYLRTKDFEADGETEVEKALDVFQQKKYDIAIFGGGINGKTREKLKKEFMQLNPELEIIEHVSHPVDMYEEIVDAFGE